MVAVRGLWVPEALAPPGSARGRIHAGGRERGSRPEGRTTGEMHAEPLVTGGSGSCVGTLTPWASKHECAQSPLPPRWWARHQGPARRHRPSSLALPLGAALGLPPCPVSAAGAGMLARPVLQTPQAPPDRIPQKWSPVLVSSSLWAWGLFCKKPLASAVDKVNLLVFFSLSKSVAAVSP